MATRPHHHHAAQVVAPANQANGDFLLQAAQSAGIKDPKELANFMGQMQVESAGFARMKEQLDYSGDRLQHVLTDKHGHIRNALTPEEVHVAAKGGLQTTAEALYGGEWGEKHLGNRQGTDDSYTFRGRGFVQLTGRDNYEHMGKVLELKLLEHPELAAEPANAASIAAQYWKERVVTHGAQHDVDHAGKLINGGANGQQERRNAVAHWEGKLAHGYKPGDPEPGQTLQDKQHPGHVLYEQALHKLEKWNHDHHIKADPQGMKNAAGALAVEAHQYGLKRIDCVEPSPSGDKLIAAQGKLGTAHSMVVEVPTATAVNTTVAQSSQTYSASLAQVQQPQQATQLAPTQEAPAMAR